MSIWQVVPSRKYAQTLKTMDTRIRVRFLRNCSCRPVRYAEAATKVATTDDAVAVRQANHARQGKMKQERSAGCPSGAPRMSSDTASAVDWRVCGRAQA